jgi:hypothetical protein
MSATDLHSHAVLPCQHAGDSHTALTMCCCPLQATALLHVLSSCAPARPSCRVIPEVLMEAARLPVETTTLDSVPFKAARVVAGWCCEAWLLADAPLLQKAAHALIGALIQYCEPLHCDSDPVL